MTTLTLSARLDRTESNTPWGFRMQGGRDYGSPLVITRVTPGSLAAKCGLQVGDAITKIGDSPTDVLVHKDAQHKIVTCGNSLELALQRGGSAGLNRPDQHIGSSAPPYSNSYGSPQPNNSAFSPVKQDQNYNAAPKPFTPAGSTMPVAVNKQYNTPLDMYSVDNVMDSLATQTAGMNMGQSGSSSNSSSPSTVHGGDKSSSGTNLPYPHASSHLDTKPIESKPAINTKTPPNIRPSFVAGASKPAPLSEKPKPAPMGDKPKYTPTKQALEEAERGSWSRNPSSSVQSRSFKFLQTMVDSGEDVTQLNKGRRTSVGNKSPTSPPISSSQPPPLPSQPPPPIPSQPPPSVMQSNPSNNNNDKFAESGSGQYVTAIVNNQYNTPMGLYSRPNKHDTFKTQSEGILANIPGVQAETFKGPGERSQIVIPSRSSPITAWDRSSPITARDRSSPITARGRSSPITARDRSSPITARDTIEQSTERKTIQIPSYAKNTDTVIESTERKTITVPSSNRHTDVVQETSERHKITMPTQKDTILVQESSERKKIVVPGYKLNQGSANSSPFGSRENLSNGNQGNTDGPKSYVPSETYRLVQEQAKENTDRASPFGSGASAAQGRTFQILQQQLDDPSGPPHGGGGGPGYKGPGAGPGSNKPAWNPKVPTGPRTMKVGQAGTARKMASAAGRIPVCNNCGVQIRGPFVSALDKTWCPTHFVCANPHCQAPLIDQGFVEEGNQLFCVRDYELYFAPKCHKCNVAIIGEIVNALKQTYHTNCFLCSQCHQPIGAGGFHTEEGKVYCQKDWASLFQTKCYGCQFPVEPGDRWVEALNQNWHSECFNCSTCQVNLEGQSFFAKSGKPYCKKHAGSGMHF